MFQTQRMADGAMLAWKTLVIRSSLNNAQCTVPGGVRGRPRRSGRAWRRWLPPGGPRDGGFPPGGA